MLLNRRVAPPPPLCVVWVVDNENRIAVALLVGVGRRDCTVNIQHNDGEEEDNDERVAARLQ